MSTHSHNHAWCVRLTHWNPLGHHNPPINGTPADPIWHATCKVVAHFIQAGSVLGLDDTALNGEFLAATCEGHGMILA